MAQPRRRQRCKSSSLANNPPFSSYLFLNTEAFCHERLPDYKHHQARVSTFRPSQYCGQYSRTAAAPARKALRVCRTHRTYFPSARRHPQLCVVERRDGSWVQLFELADSEEDDDNFAAKPFPFDEAFFSTSHKTPPQQSQPVAGPSRVRSPAPAPHTPG